MSLQVLLSVSVLWTRVLLPTPRKVVLRAAFCEVHVLTGPLASYPCTGVVPELQRQLQCFRMLWLRFPTEKWFLVCFLTPI